ncbi:antirestriction protein ArdA [Weissella coleopterorum]|uniref:Antirestriction protein ArdA n=1 Tax=Weissella coleopterorum TaxID=2714949 RepID=A0A6G8AXX7_9LACO|nr:antirestriction protein ArdA [Weissella coleopterorum]QIL49918.1 antirestriction protein ArdA [Weissella coleopterorum]
MDITGSIFVGAMLEPAKGMWFDLPVSGKKVVEQLKLMGAIGGNSGNEEYIVTDSELPFNKMNSYKSIDELSTRFKYLQTLNYDITKFKLLIDAELIDPMNFTQEDLDSIEIFNATSEKELGLELVENVGGVSELPSDNLETYFDYNFFARDHIKEGSVVEENGKYIRDNRN